MDDQEWQKFKFLGEDICVDIINKDSSDKNWKSSCHNYSNDVLMRHTLAFQLQGFLGKELRRKSFAFATVKLAPNPNGNISATDCSGDASCVQGKVGIHTNQRLISTENVDQSVLDSSPEKSVIGSPLKLKAIADLSVMYPNPLVSSPKLQDRSKLDSSCHVPLKIARKIVSKWNLMAVENLPVSMLVVLCDGEDHNKTLLLGADREIRDGRSFVKTFQVTYSTQKMSALEVPMEESVGGYQLTSIYKILDKKEGLGSILLEVRWSDPLGKVKLSKLQSAEFCLHLNIVSGCDHSPVFHFSHHLQKVRDLVEGLKTGQVPEVFSQNSPDVLQQLKKLLEKMKLGDFTNTSQFSGYECKGVTKRLKLDPPVDTDFTDHLWHIISQCTDYMDMVQCLHAIFSDLRKGSLRVFIHEGNHTTLAKLVRQSYSGMASFPILSGRLPLSLVAEIGMEKIRKDYLAIFTNNSLCTVSQWESFFQTLAPVVDETVDMEEVTIQMLVGQLGILSKLHHCLEVVSIVDTFTEGQDLRSVAKYVMNHYKLEPLDTTGKSPQFTVPVTALQAAPVMAKQPLSSVRRENGRKGASTVVSLVSDFPDGLALPSLNSNVSIVMGDSKDFLMFTTQEHLMCLE